LGGGKNRKKVEWSTKPKSGQKERVSDMKTGGERGPRPKVYGNQGDKFLQTGDERLKSAQIRVFEDKKRKK